MSKEDSKAAPTGPKGNAKGVKPTPPANKTGGTIRAPTPKRLPTNPPGRRPVAPTNSVENKSVAQTPPRPAAKTDPSPADENRNSTLARDRASPRSTAGPALAKPPKERKRKKKAKEIESSTPLAPGRLPTPIPPLLPHHIQEEMIEMRPGLTYIRISYDEELRNHLYEVIEPILEGDEVEIFDFLKDTLVRTLDGRHSGDDKEWIDYLEAKVDQIIDDHSVRVDAVGRVRLQYHVVRDFLGYGPIDVLMEDPMIEDISCDGPKIPIYIFHRQHESIRSNIIFDSDLELDSFVIRLAQRSGKHISIAEPILDATLPDGSRLQTTLSREVTTRGSSFTIRKFREDPLTPPDLTGYGTMSPEMCAYFWFVMESGASLIYAGGTASGKTTSLNAVCQFIPPEKKVVSIEDTREINLRHENWIAGLTRSGFGGQNRDGSQTGQVNMYKLLEAALRQRPEYLIVGEVRGHEALTLFQAMATGHAVYSTMHADSVSSAVHRLENPPINVPRIMLPMMDVMAIQVQVRIGERMTRRVRQVTEVTGVDPDTGDVLTNRVFEWNVTGDAHEFSGKSVVLEEHRLRNHMSEEGIQKEWETRTRVLKWMQDHGHRDIATVNKIIKTYYRDPDRVALLVQSDGDLSILDQRTQVSTKTTTITKTEIIKTPEVTAQIDEDVDGA